MNIDSTQATISPQRPATTKVSPQPAQQEKLQAEVQHEANNKQSSLSVQDAVKHLENFVSIARADISFSIDETSGVQVVKIMDRQSKEVIRQFPSEEAIRIVQALDKLQGVFVKDNV